MRHPLFAAALRSCYVAVRSVFGMLGLAFTWPRRLTRLDFRPGMKILVLCQPRLGDGVASEPLLRAVRNHLPGCAITAFVNVYMQEFMKGLCSVDSVVVDEGGGPFNFILNAARLREERYDLVIDLTTDHTLRAALLAFFCRCGFSVGYGTAGRGFLFHKSVSPAKQPLHVAERIARLAEALGIRVQDRTPVIRLSPDVDELAHRFLLDHGIKEQDLIVAIHPGGHYPTQRWPADSFARLVDRLQGDVQVVLAGSESDRTLVQGIAAGVHRKVIVFCSDSVWRLAAVLSRSSLLVCNNSGPLHMAAALGIPTVSTMGPTDFDLWHPLGENAIVVRKNLPCMPCERGWCRIKTHACMNNISVEEMYSPVKKILAEAGRQQSL